MLEWYEIKEREINGKKKYTLTFASDTKETLESFEQRVLTMFTICEHCGGEVTKSDDKYLCLNGDGIVEGKTC